MKCATEIIHVLLCILMGCFLPLGSEGKHSDWAHYLGDEGRSHYSPLDQINEGNVRRLEVAWIYQGGSATGRTQIQCNPLVVDGVLYATTATQVLVALDATNGRERWRFDPRLDGRSLNSDPRQRGVALWSGSDGRRILFAHDRYLYAVEADSGRLVDSFGERGAVDFSRHLFPGGEDGPVGSGTPGVIFEDLYILSTRTSEVAGAAPGHVLAFNVRTGERVWTFHTIPQPGEYGYETWPPEAWKSAGGANCWAGMALDTERGLVYVPTGSASYDFWGGDRLGENLFSNSLLCLDARTGKRVWHYQIVRHDLWDRDLPAPPTLHTVIRDGRRVPAVSQTTKSGHVFVFHRETGEPLFPIEERAVPPSNLEGEFAWPTQPVPVRPAPFARQAVSYDDLTMLTPEGHRHALHRFVNLRPSALYQPPSVEGTIVSPGQDGGAEWGGAAVDPDGVMVVNGSDSPGILTLVDTRLDGGELRAPGAARYVQLCAGCHGVDRAGNPQQAIPSLLTLSGRVSREDVLTAVTNGRGLMPSFRFLPETERVLLADYLLDPEGDVRGRDQPAASRGFKPSVSAGSPYGHVFERWVDIQGYPAVKPPWGTLNAINLNTGEYLWRVPLGEVEELTARGVPVTGTSNYGGPIVTAGGLVFIAGTPDRRIRAFDRQSGKVLWEYTLPAAGYATPATYSAAGRQYVVIACGGGKLGSPSADLYIAFSLPK